jgi:GNAT superfamily N-acetyltransferase
MEPLTKQSASADPSETKRGEPAQIIVRQAKIGDIPSIRKLFSKCYSHEQPPYLESLFLAQRLFGRGQFVVVLKSDTGEQVVGYASSLLLDSVVDDLNDDWNTLTAWGTLANHNPEGDFLYAAEVLVDKEFRGKGIGKLLYAERDALAQSLFQENPNFKGIAATSRLSGYSRHANLKPEDYLVQVVQGTLQDPTLSFQIGRGFRVLGLKRDFEEDPETLGWAATIFKPIIPANKSQGTTFQSCENQSRTFLPTF